MKRVGSGLRSSPLILLLGVLLLLVAGALYFASVSQADFQSRSVLISDSRPGVSATYTLGFTIPAPETLGSIKLQFCSNSPLFGDPCTAPAGFNLTGATLVNQSGETGFSIDGSTTANVLVLTRSTSAASAGAVSYVLDGVVNPSSSGSFYGRLQTFATTDATGSENDHGGLAMSMSDLVQISTTVPPYLLFCGAVTIGSFDCSTASGSYINFGNVSSLTTASATSELLSATNAQSGFSVTIFGSTMTSGNNVIPALAIRDVSRPGTAQFGINLVSNLSPGVGADPEGPGAAQPATGYDQADFYKFNSGDTIATATAFDDYRKLTVSYIINIPSGQPIGVYSSTLTYVCLANF